ncbi:unnamed protein product [Staurois parvus]|uniref:Uncharacterized protein n=1 Tax=Staurois parvus TaxID=386267 RepID=A0ABN9DPV0_9NEOB|nr:unnamed protein product [Staurois parvus]
MEAIQHPMNKMEPTSSVRRPESWHMAECGDGDSSNGRPYRTHDTHSGPGSSMRRRVQGPMTDYRPGSSMSRYGAHGRLRAMQQAA